MSITERETEVLKRWLEMVQGKRRREEEDEVLLLGEKENGKADSGTARNHCRTRRTVLVLQSPNYKLHLFSTMYSVC